MPNAQTCPECDRSFHCGSDSPDGSCWCGALPRILPPDPSTTCRCPDCLARATGRLLTEKLNSISHNEALALAASQAPSPRLIEHIDYTVEDGNWVFSAWYLLKQGRCCGNGCRNCPYPKDA